MRLQPAIQLREQWRHLDSSGSDSRATLSPPVFRLKHFADIKVYRELGPEIRSHWIELSKNAVQTPYQSLKWYEAWLTTAGKSKAEKPFIVAVFDADGNPTVIVPLVLQGGPVTLAKFPGGKHANYNFPLVRRDVEIAVERRHFLSEALGTVSSGVDLFWFDAQPLQWQGMPNPLLTQEACQEHAATSSVLELADGTGTRNASFRHRSSYRKLQKLGAIVKRAGNEHDISAVLKSFFSQKSQWFRARELPDSFAQQGISEFFRKLFSKEGPGELFALQVGDDTLAVAGVLVSLDRASLMFVSYDLNHPLAKLGLGTHLIRSLIEEFNRRSIAQVDFGLGDAEYKRLLGARTEPAFVSFKAVTAKGRIVAFVLAAVQTLKAYMKRSDWLFRLVQRVRRCGQTTGTRDTSV